jgi:septal ring-binding cell division protein DamX
MSTSLLLALRSSNEIESDSLWVGFLICHLKQLADGTLKTVVSSINISELNLSVSNRSSQGFDFPVSYRNKHRTDPMLRFEYLLEAQDINQSLDEFGRIVEVRLLLASLNDGSLFNNGGEFEIVLHHGPKVEKMIVSHSHAMTHGLWWQIAKPNISSEIEILESPQLVVADQWHGDIKNYCNFVTQGFEIPAKSLAKKGDETNTHPVVVATEPAYVGNSASYSEEGNAQKVLLTSTNAAQVSKLQSYWPVYVVIGIVVIWLMINSDIKNTPIDPPVAEVVPVIDNVDHVMPEDVAATDSALVDPSQQLDYIADADESHGSQYRTIDWLKAQGSSAWTLQIASFGNESDVRSYLSNRNEEEPFAYFIYPNGENNLYVVTYGNFATMDIALKKANSTDFGLSESEHPIPVKIETYVQSMSNNQLSNDESVAPSQVEPTPKIAQEVPRLIAKEPNEVNGVVLTKKIDEAKNTPQDEKKATGNTRAVVDVNAINIKIVTLAKQKDNTTLVEWEASNKSGITLSLVKFKINLFDDGEVPQVKTTIKDSFKVLGPCGTLPYRMIFSYLGDIKVGRVAISVVEAEAYAPTIAPLSCN